MEYQVPQFIEVEDKVIGPLTLRQFIYVAGGAGLCVLFFAYLPTIFALLLSLLVAGFAGALAFYKVNNKPFIEVLEAGFNFYTRSKLFLWKHEDRKMPTQNAPAVKSTEMTGGKPPRLTRGRLSDLAWSLDVKPAGGEPSERES